MKSSEFLSWKSLKSIAFWTSTVHLIRSLAFFACLLHLYIFCDRLTLSILLKCPCHASVFHSTVFRIDCSTSILSNTFSFWMRTSLKIPQFLLQKCIYSAFNLLSQACLLSTLLICISLTFSDSLVYYFFVLFIIWSSHKMLLRSWIVFLPFLILFRISFSLIEAVMKWPPNIFTLCNFLCRYPFLWMCLFPYHILPFP